MESMYGKHFEIAFLKGAIAILPFFIYLVTQLYGSSVLAYWSHCLNKDHAD